MLSFQSLIDAWTVRKTQERRCCCAFNGLGLPSWHFLSAFLVQDLTDISGAGSVGHEAGEFSGWVTGPAHTLQAVEKRHAI